MTEAKRGLRFWGLLASLGVNILFIGLAVGMVLHGPRMMFPPGGPPPHGMVEHMTRGMTPADAEIIKQAFGEIKDLGNHAPGDHEPGDHPPGDHPPGDHPPNPPSGDHPGGFHPPGPPHELDAERRHIQELLVAPTLDATALAAALDAEAAKRAAFEASIRTAFLTAAPKLSLEGRRQLVHNFDGR